MFTKKKLHAGNATILSQEPINSIIGKDLFIQGELKGEGTIRIDGRVEGNIFLEKGVIVGEHANILGDVKSENLIVYGKLTGNILCKSIQIKSSGIIKGDIHTDVVLIETGGKYNGQLHMHENSDAEGVLKTLPTTETEKKRLA